MTLGLERHGNCSCYRMGIREQAATGWLSVNRASRSILTLNRKQEFKVLSQMLGFKPTDNVLDVGTGDGFWTARMAKHCANIVGVEPDRNLLGYARTIHAGANLRYVRATAENLPFEDCSFDKVISVSCLEHFQDPEQGLRQMARVLKPGGRLAISVDSLLPENSDSGFREWHKQRHFVTRYFRHDELCGMIESAGLRCEPQRTVHIFRSRVAAWVRQVVTRRPKVWLPFFPLSYLAVRGADWQFDDMPGQIIIVAATR